jgi:hypothetical protein
MWLGLLIIAGSAMIFGGAAGLFFVCLDYRAENRELLADLVESKQIAAILARDRAEITELSIQQGNEITGLKYAIKDIAAVADRKCETINAIKYVLRGSNG